MTEPVKIKGWPGGMNNILSDFEIPEGLLRNAVNVDILDSGAVRRRKGSTQAYAGTGIHSFWSNGSIALFVESGSLKRLNDDFTGTVLHADVGTSRMQYEEVNGEIFYTNTTVTGKIVNGARREWGVETPSSAPTIDAIAGGLDEGIYQAVCTYVNDLGEESACGYSARRILTARGGLTIHLPAPASSEVRQIRVYMTAPNGDVLYEVAEVPFDQAQITISSAPPYGRACRTQFMCRAFAAEMLTYYNGRLYLAIDGVLWYTEPYALGLIKPAENYIQFGAGITIVKAVRDGLYVAAGKTAFLSGSGPDDFTHRDIFPFGAARYSASGSPENNDVVWFSDRGIVLAGDAGAAVLVQSQNVMPDAYSTGATIIKEMDSLKQIVSVVSGNPEASSLTAVDFMEVEVIRAKGKS